MKYLSICLGIALVLVCQPGEVRAQQTLLLRQPALSAKHLAFVYAGDIWVADRNGDNPRRLTSSPYEEGGPVFSPDGLHIAFVGDYENNADVYVIATTGGQPKRLTWHPGEDVVIGWTPDGKAIAMVSARETDHGRSAQLYHVSLQGGLPEKQMEARIYRGTYDVQAKRLAYIDHGSGYNGLFGGSSGWKGYRGGTTPEVRIMDLRQQTVTTIGGAGATNFNPLWVAGELYFLSDREHKIFNLFHYQATTGEVRQITHERTWDVRAAAGHGTSVVYEAGGRLKQLDLASGKVNEIAIHITPDLPQLRSQWKSANDTVESVDISPSGKRALVTARGEVFSVPAKDGSIRNLSASSQREYTALWSPDGEEIAYIVESARGQTLAIKNQTGIGDARRFELGPYFYELLEWSGGDRQRIIFQDNHLSLHAIDLGSGQIAHIATSTRRENVDTSFSPGGRWLAYTQVQPNYHRDLILYDFQTSTATTVTDGTADVASPAFSQDGKYLYFAASTNAGPTRVGLNMTSQERPYRAALYAVVLAADGKSPLLPKSGDENDEPEKEDKDEDKDKKKDNGDKDKPVVEAKIDLENIDKRIVALPVAEANYFNLSVDKKGNLFYIQGVQPGVTNEPPGENVEEDNALTRFDFEEKEAKALLEGVNSFVVSAGGEHMVIQKVNGSLAIAEIKGDELKPEALKLDGLGVRVDPREEWAQIFDEAWRMEKEYFYADNMHGLDWQSIYDRYRPLLDHVGRREDLNALLVEMIAEMQVGHNRIGGGDVYSGDRVRTGLLGANFHIDKGRYRLAKVYTGESWNPFLKAPLATPGNEAREGEYILVVNGREVTDQDNIFAILQGLNDQQVTLRVAPNANGRDARDIVVEPVVSEGALRLWAWIESNRLAVDKATNGKVGYVYLPNTAGAGYTFFNRMFFSQVDKEGLIIDERANGGGQAANYITEVLSRVHLSGWKDRDGDIFNTPAGAVYGPKVMLIDQDAGSGGDYLPYSFRHLGIGKLIGTRTWGGLIGIAINPRLMDGGFLSVPFFRFFDPDHNWTIENEGVAPDIEVELDPIATNQGRDTQLERAIADVLDQLGRYEPKVPKVAPALPTELGK